MERFAQTFLGMFENVEDLINLHNRILTDVPWIFWSSIQIENHNHGEIDISSLHIHCVWLTSNDRTGFECTKNWSILLNIKKFLMYYFITLLRKIRSDRSLVEFMHLRNMFVKRFNFNFDNWDAHQIEDHRKIQPTFVPSALTSLRSSSLSLTGSSVALRAPLSPFAYLCFGV